MHGEEQKPGMGDRRIRKTRKLLKQGLARLLQEKSINEITVKELVDLIDINRGTFYLHCRDIYDLLDQLEDEMMRDLTELLNVCPGDRVIESIDEHLTALIRYIADNSELCLALLGQNGDLAFMNKLIDTVKNTCFQNLKDAFPSQSASRSEMFAQYLVTGSIGVLRSWVEQGMQESAEEMGDLLAVMIKEGAGFLEQAG